MSSFRKSSRIGICLSFPLSIDVFSGISDFTYSEDTGHSAIASEIFSEPLMLSGVGMSSVPPMPVYTYMVHTYQQIFVNLRFGYGLALTWVVFIIMVAATLINEWTSSKWVHVDE